MKRLLPITLAASLAFAGEAEAKNNDAVAYTPQQLSAMCNPTGSAIDTANYPNIKGATADVNAALAEALRDPKNRELAAVLSNELLDALYEKMSVTNSDPKAVLDVLGDIQMELDQLMTRVNYGDEEQVGEAIEKINGYTKGLEVLSILLSSLANENGNALTRRQLLERYESDLDTVDRAWRVDNALTALDELDVPSAWDCTPIVYAYGATGEWPTSLDEIEDLEAKGELSWTTPELSVITGPQYTFEYDYDQNLSTERRSRKALSEAYEAATAAITDVVADLQPLVTQFERRQGLEFQKDEDPAVELVWGSVAATEPTSAQ